MKIPVWAKLLASLLLLSGLGRSMLYRRTADGFEILTLPYPVLMLLTLIFNFIVVAVFMLLLKDAVFILLKVFTHAKFPGHYASLFVFSLALVATVYGTYEGLRLPGINRHDVVIDGLGRELDGLKVAVLVDIHADELTNHETVKAIVERTNSLEPDVILIPGDFVDGTVRARSKDLEPLRDLRAKLGVYGTTGNHEYYYDYAGWTKRLPELGIRMLMNEHVVIESGDSKLVLAGTVDPTSGSMGMFPHDTRKALKDAPEGVPVLLMDHQPRFARENAELGVSFQVSGHTHGGQMPGVYTLAKKANAGFVRGWYDAGGMKLYVSPGTSQWNGFACRIFDPSEITLFTLRASE